MANSFQFGKHAGKAYSDPSIDSFYFSWMIDTKKKEIAGYQAELDRRAAAEEAAENASQSMHERIIREGYRALAKKLHPDAGGSTNEFKELQGSYEVLQGIMREVKGGK
jgi:hypothetical protein